jgi:hypothetical protein
MNIKFLLAPAAAGFVLLSTLHAGTIAEDFSHDPALDGWRVFGDSSLFQWDAVAHNLRVTWDSSQPNSYFYHPLGTILGTNDDFSISFDLYLTDYAAGLTDDTSFPFQLAAGLQNFAEASLSGFLVGTGANAPDLAEFDFFPPASGFAASVDPTFIDSANIFSSNAYGYVALPTGIVMRVSLDYTTSNQTAVLTITTNGAAVLPPMAVNLTVTNAYENTRFGDYHLDTFAVESYSGAESGSSVLAHGTIGNVLLVVPPPPVTLLQGSLVNGVGQVQFASLTNWNYILQCSADLQTWLPAAPPAAGTGGNLILQDTNSMQPHQFYRVNALRAD